MVNCSSVFSIGACAELLLLADEAIGKREFKVLDTVYLNSEKNCFWELLGNEMMALFLDEE